MGGRRSEVRGALPEPKEEPVRIEQYQILEKIGEGAHSTVFRARHLVLEKEVALKVLSPALERDPDYMARLLREARAAARLSHENLVLIHDAGKSCGRHYIAMELVEGPNLEQVIRRDGPLSELGALEVGLCVARALEAAYEARIVHRDIKPENIVRTPDGRIKLLDLGLARRAAAPRGVGEDEGYITDHGRTLGTPYFVSPEQARGEDLDVRSDLYSLGVTLFYLATGKCPFEGASPAEIMRRHIADPVPSPRVLRPSLSPGFELVLQKLMAKDPKRRYQTPRELSEALELLISGSGEEGREFSRALARERRDSGRAPVSSGLRAIRAQAAAEPFLAPGEPRGPGQGGARSVMPRERRTTIARLALACGGVGIVGFLALVLLRSLGPPRVSADELAAIEREERAQEARRAEAEAAKKARAPAAPVREDESVLTPARRLERDLARAREYEREGEYAKARALLERVRGYAGPESADLVLDEIARIRKVEEEARLKAASTAPFAERVSPPLATPGVGVEPVAPTAVATGNPPAAGEEGFRTVEPVTRTASAPAGLGAEPASPRPAPRPAARTAFEELFARILLGRFQCDPDQRIGVAYPMERGGEKALLNDFEIARPPVFHGPGPDGYNLRCGSLQPAKLLFRVPFAEPFEFEIVALVSGRNEAANLVIAFGDKRDGADFAASTDGGLYRRKSGDPVTMLRKPARPSREELAPGRSLGLLLRVEGGKAALFRDGKPAFVGAEVRGGDSSGFLGFEALGCDLTLRELRVRGQPEPAWLVRELTRVRERTR